MFGIEVCGVSLWCSSMYSVHGVSIQKISFGWAMEIQSFVRYEYVDYNTHSTESEVSTA